MIVLCCLPVIAGCAIIWKSEWTYRAAAPVVGYSLIGFFGGTVSLVITVGMSNVAGHTKKSFMAATIFVAYCVGNIVGPQLIRSQTKAQHYPELWTGLIVWSVSPPFARCSPVLLTSVLGSGGITIAAAISLYAVLYRENQRKLPIEGNEEEAAKLAFQDLTDKENPYFRYVL